MLDKKKLTCAEAKKNISIKDFLALNGYYPISPDKNKLEYISPFRKESKGSFIVNQKLGIWIDFGDSPHNNKLGGTLIDLGIRLYNCSIQELLKRLEQVNFSLIQQDVYIEDTKIKIVEAINITDIRLINYLKERRIDLAIAQKYCREVHFEVNGKNYFALGLENINKGWELRNKYFKGSSSPKDITLIKNNTDTVCCFEGMCDFLSYFGSKFDLKRPSDYLILNSTSFLERCKKFIINYKEAYFFLDNDHAGTTTTGILKGMFLGRFFDMSTEYKPHKDLNDFHIAKTKEREQKFQNEKQKLERKSLPQDFGLGM